MTADKNSWHPHYNATGNGGGKDAEEAFQTCIIDIVKRYLKGAAAQEHLGHELEFQRSLGTCAGNDNDSDTREEADRDKDEEENKEDSGHTQKKRLLNGEEEEEETA